MQDETPDDKFKDDWKDFFGPIQPDFSVNRGFYNFYPVERAKPGSLVAAYFGDPAPAAKAKDPRGADVAHAVSGRQQPDRRRHARHLAGLGRDVAAATEE